MTMTRKAVRGVAGKSKRRFDRKGLWVHSISVLLLLTLLSVHFVSGLYARYFTGEMTGGGASIASGGSVEVLEHRAYFDTAAYRYVLDRDNLVTNNTYDVLVPGMNIEKDPFVRLAGDNDVSYTLYLEVVPSRPDIMTYKMSDHWQSSQRFSAQHGGSVYVFQSVIAPHEKRDISGLLSGGKIHIRSTLKDKQEPEVNSEPFRVDMYAYLVQVD